MSSSGHNLNPFPYFPSTSTPYNLPLSLPSLPNYDPSGNSTIFNIHQAHHDPVSFLTPYLPVSSHFSQFSAPENVINLAVSNNFQALGGIPDLLTKSAPATATKKDRHSKIYTAQGLRDRRVRLSIDIARKFFDLQDMLGYDKASKTLEWLFSKSRKAIKELSRASHGSVGAKKVSFVSDVENPEEEEEEGLGQKSKSMMRIDEEGDIEGKVSKVEVFQVIAKESRAKARARARERTVEKMGTKQFSDEEEICNQKTEVISNNHWKHLDQSETSDKRVEEFSMFKRKSAKKLIDDTKMSLETPEISHWKFLDQIKASKGLLEEPSIIKRKVMKPSIISGSSQRNLVFSIDSIPINYLSQSWDTNGPNYPLSK